MAGDVNCSMRMKTYHSVVWPYWVKVTLHLHLYITVALYGLSALKGLQSV